MTFGGSGVGVHGRTGGWGGRALSWFAAMVVEQDIEKYGLLSESEEEEFIHQSRDRRTLEKGEISQPQFPFGLQSN